MPTYRFKALNEDGHKIVGEREAASESALDRELRAVGLELLSFDEERYRKPFVFGRVKRQDMAVMCVQMHHMLRAGIPVMEALDGAQQSLGPGLLRSVLAGVHAKLTQGETLAQAFAHYPKVFSRFFVGMVAVGEKTGKTPLVFDELERYIKWTIHLRFLTIKALRYPLISMFFTSGLVFLFIAYGLSFAINGTVRLPQEWLRFIPVPGFLLYYWPYVIFLPPGLYWTIPRLCRASEGFARAMDELLLKIPFAGEIVARFNFTRFIRVFALLFSAGIDVRESIRIATGTMGNRILQEQVVRVEEYLARGMTLTDSVRMCGCFPQLVVQAFHTGEATGNMGEAFEKVDFFYTRQVDDAVSLMIGTIRPALTVFSGFLMLDGGASTQIR